MNMPDSEAKRKWMRENAIIFSMKLMKRTESDIIEFLEKMAEKGFGKATVFKLAMREYMANHKEEA